MDHELVVVVVVVRQVKIEPFPKDEDLLNNLSLGLKVVRYIIHHNYFLIVWWVGWLVGWLVRWLVGWLVDWLVG